MSTILAESQKMFDKLVRVLETFYDDQMKTNFDLIAIGKAIFPELQDNVVRNLDVDLTRPPRYMIVNTNNSVGLHWVGVHIVGKKIYVFDSFARKTTNIMPSFVRRAEKAGFTIIETRKRVEQADSAQDCGLRSLSWLIILMNKGLRFAMTI